MKRIEPPVIREIARGMYKNFRGPTPGCPPHRRTVPKCRECDHIGDFLHICLVCRYILNSGRRPITECRHPRTSTKCASCGKIGRFGACCLDCRKVLS